MENVIRRIFKAIILFLCLATILFLLSMFVIWIDYKLIDPITETQVSNFGIIIGISWFLMFLIVPMFPKLDIIENDRKNKKKGGRINGN